jgi:PhzF family phenazine biosynthesis protein
VRLRSFAPGAGIPEDPVCGSGNGCVGAYLARASGARTPLAYRAEQGIEMGRAGRASVRVEPEGDEGWRVQVGGTAVTVLEGELRLHV